MNSTEDWLGFRSGNFANDVLSSDDVASLADGDRNWSSQNFVSLGLAQTFSSAPGQCSLVRFPSYILTLGQCKMTSAPEGGAAAAGIHH